MPKERIHGDMEGRWQLIDTAHERDDPRYWWLSTVFLAVDHGGYIYESLVKIGDHDDVIDRYRTRIEATYGHWFYVRMCRWMVERGVLPVAPLDEDEDLLTTYSQIDIAREHCPARYPGELYHTRTLCCDETVTHEVSDWSSFSLAKAPEPRCSWCKEVITHVRFESISRTEDV